MLDKLKSFFSDAGKDSQGQHASDTHLIELAAAALLVEISHADHAPDPRESAAIVAIVRKTLHLDRDESRQLLEQAQQHQSSATSLYEFTDLINRHFDKAQKVKLVEDCWRVAFADGSIDRYEDHMIRKIAELIYVSHGDFIRSKLRVADSTA